MALQGLRGVALTYPTPLLILSDDVTSPSGLSRITRELALRIHGDLSDHFIVATLSLAHPSQPTPELAAALPFKQYRSRNNLGMIPLDLPTVWRDFTGMSVPHGHIPEPGRGILLVIQNASWAAWLSHPELLEPSDIKEFLLARPFHKWLYCPIDGDGPNQQFLPQSITAIIAHFDRHLAYCDWAAKLIDRSMPTPPQQPTHHLPHGIDTSIFHSRDKQLMRRSLVERLTGQDAIIPDDSLLLGIVATNSSRKDLHLALEACMLLRRRGIDLRIWLHTNHLTAYWNLPELVEEFRLDGITLISTKRLRDEEMAQCYCAMDVTLAPGRGGGFEFPIFESLACGVPSIHIDYAGAAEFLPAEFKIEPVGFSGDVGGIRRPHSRPEDWADAVMRLRGHGATLPPVLDWENAWPQWKEWFLRSVE